MQSTAAAPPHTLMGTLRVCKWLFHMHVAVLAYFPRAGPQGSAGEEGDGAGVHFGPRACLHTRILKFKVQGNRHLHFVDEVCLCVC